MTIALVVGRNEKERLELDWFISDWRESLMALDPTVEVRLWPDIGNQEDIKFILAWQPPLGVFLQFPHLKAIGSLGAGVDHLLVDPQIPKNISIVRVVDPYMAHDIVQYVVACVLHYVKRMDHWQHLQLQQTWGKKPPFNLSDKTIGILGVGYLGAQAVKVLQSLGLKVVGWSNSRKNIPGMETYVGDKEFTAFLSQSEILICMLPLTSATKNILNRDTFAQLPKNTYLINLGRGEHLVEQDLLEALDTGQLSGAALDVFRTEPLPKEHPFWSHHKIRVTPHIASVTNARTVAPQMLENYRRVLAGEELIDKVDREKGY